MKVWARYAVPVMVLVDEQEDSIERIVMVPGERFIDRETMGDMLSYSAFADEHLVALAIVAGADALMSKAADPDALCDTVRALADGTARLPTVTPATMQAVASQLDTTDLPIFGMLAHGTPPVEIATTLRIDEDWLDTRRWAMLARLTGGSQRRSSPRRHSRLS